MTSKVAASRRTSADSYATAAVRSVAGDVAPARRMTEPEASQAADLRLVIEETGEPGQFVYTIIDRRTGRIVSRRARDEVLRLREDDGYAAGALFDGTA